MTKPLKQRKKDRGTNKKLKEGIIIAGIAIIAFFLLHFLFVAIWMIVNRP